VADPTAIDADFPLSELFEFVEELREDFEIGLHEFIAVQEIVLGLARQGRLPADPMQIEGYLGPILCSNRREQAEFHRRYSAWCERVEKAAQAPPSPAEHAELRWDELRRRHLRFNWFTGALLAFAGVFVLAWAVDAFRAERPAGSTQEQEPGPGTKPGPQPAPGEEPVDSRSNPYLAELALSGVAFVIAVLFARALWRRRQAEAFLSRGGTHTVPDAETMVLNMRAPPLSDRRSAQRIATALRRRRAIEATQLDLVATMRRTALNAGRFTEVRRQRTGVPEYLVLIHRETSHDLQCSWFEQLLDSLVADGVHLVRFYFTRDPAVVFQPDPGSPPLALRELASRYPTHRLGIFADAQVLIDPLRQRPARVVAELLVWPEPVVFTPERPENWGRAIRTIAEAGMKVAPADDHGLLEAWGDPQGRRPRAHGAPVSEIAPMLPRILREDGRRWLAPSAPEPSVLAALLGELRRYLGERGYFWLSACAMYPQLRWPLAVGLGFGLEDTPPDPETARRLVRLPWFRAAHMPDWLRSRMLEDLPRGRFEHARLALERTLVGAARARKGETRLELARDDSALLRAVFRRLARRWRNEDDSPLEDRVFLRSMTHGFGVRASGALRRALQGARARTQNRLPHRDLPQTLFGVLLQGFLFPAVIVLALGTSRLETDSGLILYLCAAAAGVLIALLGVPLHLRTPAVDATGAVGWTNHVAPILSGALLLLVSATGIALALVPAIGLAVIALVGSVLAMFEKSLTRGSLLVVLIAAPAFMFSGAIALTDPSPLGGLFIFIGFVLAINVLLFLAALPSAVVYACARAIARLRQSKLSRATTSARGFLDRWALDRLLLESSSDAVAPHSYAKTALGAAAIGAAVGAAVHAMSPAALGRSSEEATLMLAYAAGAVFLIFPYLAGIRYVRNGRFRAAGRASYEYVLAALVALAVWQPSTDDFVVALLIAVLNWVFAVGALFLFGRNLGAIAAPFLERNAPDRFVDTQPRFFGVFYACILALALWGRMPVPDEFSIPSPRDIVRKVL
jgi:hypothetical protein